MTFVIDIVTVIDTVNIVIITIIVIVIIKRKKMKDQEMRIASRAFGCKRIFSREYNEKKDNFA